MYGRKILPTKRIHFFRVAFPVWGGRKLELDGGIGVHLIELVGAWIKTLQPPITQAWQAHFFTWPEKSLLFLQAGSLIKYWVYVKNDNGRLLRLEIRLVVVYEIS